MARYILVWKVHWVILEVQKPQENLFVQQLNAATLLWHPFSKVGLSNEETSSFHWSLTFRRTKVRNEDSVSCWAPFAEYSESSVLSEQAHTCTEVLVLNKRHYFQALFPHFFPLTLLLFFHQQTQHAIKTSLLPDTRSQWVLLELRAILAFMPEGCCCLLGQTVMC